ncbi:hypothetical protein [Pelosinus baikalensis]|uniref:Phage protein n=1 Tax=Pelosinus baikalensis TaxID=2892015 RepID=A0ABS8I0V3_9FIRM|nr:hypothetical protein [Pelosinus baikalensis]MCC5468596.1 hypothetical protein [Pelosinus baikalensis]
MTLSNDLIQQIKKAKDQLDCLKFENVDFIIQNGEVTRVDIGRVFVWRKKNNWLTDERKTTLPGIARSVGILYLWG